MGVRSLCIEPHRALRATAQPVETFNGELQGLVRDLIETMYANQGIGLAAPQVGQSIQLFVANPLRERGQELVVANPIIEWLRGRSGVVEGCLSLPNMWERVNRAARIRMSGRNVHGKPITIEAEGLLAIVLQHEFDHLQGRLFIDRLSWFRRRRLQRRARAAPCA